MLRTRKTMACVVPECYMTRGKKVRGEPPVAGYCMKPNAWIMYMIAVSGSGKTRKEISDGYKQSQTSWLQQNPGLSRREQKERMNTEMCAAIAEWSRREPRIRERANVNDGDRKKRRRNARERVAKEKKKASEDSRKKRAGAEAGKRRSEKEKADKAAAKKQAELQRAERVARERRREKDKADRAAERKKEELERAERVAKDKRKEMKNRDAEVKRKTLEARIAKKKQKELTDKALANKVSEKRKKKLADAEKAAKKKQKELEDADRAAKKKQKELEDADKATKKKQKELDDADRAATKKQKALGDADKATKKKQKELEDADNAKKSQKQASAVFFAERDVPPGWSTEKAVADITYGFNQMSRDDDRKKVLVKWTSDGGLREEDVESLLPGEWYFDRAIDKYADLLQTLSGRTHKCVFLETVFYQNLMAKMRGGKRTWKDRHATQAAFFTPDLDTTHRHAKIFIPVILNRNHFILLFVDNQKHTVYSLDSAGCLRKQQRQNILKWVEQEHSAKNATFNKEEWKTEAMKCPEQTNDFDCGPFTCLFMAFLSHGKRLHFTQDDLPKMRERINWSLLNSRLETRAEIRESLRKRRKGRSSLLNSASDTRAAHVRRQRRAARLAALLKERKQAKRHR